MGLRALPSLHGPASRSPILGRADSCALFCRDDSRPRQTPENYRPNANRKAALTPTMACFLFATQARIFSQQISSTGTVARSPQELTRSEGRWDQLRAIDDGSTTVPYRSK